MFIYEIKYLNKAEKVNRYNLHYEQFPDGTVKCIEDEIPFELPEGWAWTKVDSIAFVTKLAGFEYTKNIAPNLCETGIPLFKGKNVKNGVILYEFESYIPESVSDELQRSKITRKCILTPYVGTIGNIGIHKREGKYHLGSNVGKIELYNTKEKLMEEYVVAYLRSKSGYQQLTKHMKATAQASISIEAIRDVYIPIPPSTEQKRIIHVLIKFLSLVVSIDDNMKAITHLISTTKAHILDLAIRGKLVPQNPDDEPASVLIERIRAEKEQLIKDGKIMRDKKGSYIFRGEDNSYYLKSGNAVESIVDWDMENLPKSWAVCCLGEVCDYGNCVNIDTKDIPDSAWTLDLEDIEKDSGAIIKRVSKKERDSSSTKHLFSKGQVLYSKLRPYLNKVVLADNNGYCTSEILPLDFDNCILPEYARYYLMSPTFLKYANQCSYGVKMPRLGTQDGKKAVLAIPPKNEQQRIAEKINQLFSVLDNMLASID
ncbi:MAG: restriction endonuclease subunit S [Ruminococcus sp.]|nr:restriction endonuclease subunit S [Ruminococcus sp.]